MSHAGAARNRRLEVAAAGLRGGGDALLAALLSPLLLDLTDNYELIGAAEAIPAAVFLLVALPAAYCSQRSASDAGKNAALILASAAIAALAILYALVVDLHVMAFKTFFWIAVGILCVGRIGYGGAVGAVGSIFQNSVPSSERAWWSTVQLAAGAAGGLLGPVVSIIVLTTTHSDAWAPKDLVYLLAIVASLYVLQFGLELQMSRKDELGSETSELEQAFSGDKKKAISYRIPITILAIELWFGIASGITVKFFSLWLKQLGLSPAIVILHMALVEISIATLAFVAEKIQKKLGRLPTDLLFKAIGLSCFLLIVVSDSLGWWQSLVPLQGCLFILRTSAMNSTKSLTDSLANDALPRQHRAVFNAADSVAGFGWSASSFLGGFILEKLVTGNGDPLQSYRNLFLVTFSMQAAGLLPTMWLWWVTRRDGAVKEPVTKESIGDSGNDIGEARELLSDIGEPS